MTDFDDVEEECAMMTDQLHTLKLHCPLPLSTRPARCAPGLIMQYCKFSLELHLDHDVHETSGELVEGFNILRNNSPLWREPRRIYVPTHPLGEVHIVGDRLSSVSGEDSGAVEVCTMVRDEAPNIVEWVEYHLMVLPMPMGVFIPSSFDDNHRECKISSP